MHELVTAQAVAAPDALAVVMGAQAISYAELNRRANHLAHYLQALGAAPNVLVGICIERSVELVIGLLGILKAGAAYVPCDPGHPVDRIAYTLRDAAAPVLVTRRRWAVDLAPAATHVVCLDDDAELLGPQDDRDPAVVAVSASDLAYVMYTSGSTGQPKGVQITHGNLLNLVRWHQTAFQVSAADRATQVASPAFDATGWELWPYLTLGASVHFPDDEVRGQPEFLRDWLVAQRITITFLPTPLAERMIGLDWPSETALRLLLTGADTLQRYPRPGLPFALVNNYGPTEATVVSTSGVVSPEANPQHLPTIGRPIANTQIYILDEQHHAVADGEMGELCIGGAGVARGYLNRSQLDAERFLSDPFSDEPGARLYRTGDLARYLPDGQLEFLGRLDDQIKVRGYRIEPGEITAVLSQLSAIQTSFVTAFEAAPDEKRLVAYVVLVPGARVSANTLRDRLSVSLPDYMIPSAFVEVEALPISPNGKVDRKALPPPSPDNALATGVSSAPSSPIEELVARMVATLLGLDAVDADDNFFLLGGHSMLGAQLVMQVADVFDVELPLRSLFEAPTVRRLSGKIEASILAKVEAMSDDEVRQLLG